MRGADIERKKKNSTTSGLQIGLRIEVYTQVYSHFFGDKKMIDKQQENQESTEEIIEQDFAKPEMQEARAFLRERFLRVVTGIVGKQAKFHLHENTTVSGEFRGCDVDGHEIYVKNLETPLGKVPQVILRANDVIDIQIDDFTNQR